MTLLSCCLLISFFYLRILYLFMWVVLYLNPWGASFPCPNILIMSVTLPFYSCMLQPVHSLRAPSYALAIFSEENWEQLHNCAVLKVGLESQLAELLGGGLHVSGLVYISSQLVYPELWASVFIHLSFTWMIQSLSSVKLMFSKLSSCPDFELLGKCYYDPLPQTAFLFYIRV